MGFGFKRVWEERSMMESELPPGSCNSTGHLSTIGWNIPGRMHHSASTPAGVDGGGARTPPATPKKGGKMLAVRVQMLDDTISMFQIQSKALGRVLFDQVCRQLHLLEADYFGLEYQDANSTKYWLDVEKPMCRQVGLLMLEPTLRFCVKFYTPDPARLEEEFTRYLFCLQVKRDLAYGCIQCNENTAALMASYIVQAECGDFVPEDYPDHTYLSGYKFFPGQDAESERRIMENHKKHIGQSPAEADLNLLETARRCELYGIKMHPAKDHEGVPLNLAVAHMGIVVFQHFTKINTFSWAKIRKISFKRKKFLIKLHPEGYGYFRDVVEFFFEGRNECKNFWKKCVENHGFFRCTSVPRLPRHKTRVMSRGSSFRYSGKTQKQIVEFVRDNYVKRQTFQRSGSFRASRSAASSRAAVSAPPAAAAAAPPALNASLSAHPLLPLPPGSDAISLEWDKQPHYLEASLMMKGYTAEEARRRSEGARPPRPHRPPLAPTAYAATRDKLRKLYSDQIVGPEVVTHAEVNHHPTEGSPLPHRTTTPLVSPESTWTVNVRGSGRARAPTPPPRGRPASPDGTSPEEDNTVSSASLCMSPTSDVDRTAPLYSSTPIAPRTLANGYTAVNCRKNRDDNDNRTTDNDNHNVDNDNGIHDVDNRTCIDNGLHVDNRVASVDDVDNVDAFISAETRINVKNRVGSVDSRIGSIDNVDKRTSNDDVINHMGKRLGKIIDYDTANGNVTVNIVSESTNSMDVLSGGESDAGDTLSRRNNNNSIASGVATIGDTARRRGGDVTYYVAKELLMTERTYKRDLELITVSWSKRVGRLGRTASSGAEAGALARGCLALEPLALPAGALLARLERALAAAPAPPPRTDTNDAEEPEYKKIAELLYDYLSSTFDAYAEYTCNAGALAALVESAPLPLAALLLRPLHRTLHYRRLAHELCTSSGASDGPSAAAACAALELAERAAAAAAQQLRHVENHTALCQMQRDIVGYDKLLVAEREFIRLGCLYKHSSKGLQQRMLFLFSDLLLITSKCASGRFRAHVALALHRLRLEPAASPHTLALTGDDVNIILSANNEQEYIGWRDSLATAIENAQDNPTEVDTELSPCDNESECAEGGAAGGALAAVCWHRAASLPRQRLHAAMRTQLSGYLLRKFKNSHGWQKLWVVFAAFTLFFYKSWQDDTPLASLPLLGYSVGPPAESDCIGKEFVFKLQFKNHVYFFRADSHFTFNRWIEVLQTPMVHSDHN